MQHRKRQITLKQRMGLCLAAFFAAFAMQLTLNGYQSRAVQAVQDAQMGCFNAISRFQGGVELYFRAGELPLGEQRAGGDH